MRCGFRPHDRDRTTYNMEESLVGFGLFREGVFLHTQTDFAITRLTVGVPNDLQMERNLTGGLPVVYQGHLTSLSPFRECLTPAHERKQEGCTGGDRSAGLKNGQRGKCSDARDEHVCKCDAHDDMI